MLEEAVQLAQQGRVVYIYGLPLHKYGLMADLGRLTTDAEILKLIKIEQGWPRSLDVHTLRGFGMHSNCVVLIDHALLETEFSKVLEMLHRYDKDDDS